jgi:hypothetical protein
MLKRLSFSFFMAILTLFATIPCSSHAAFSTTIKLKPNTTVRLPICGDATCNGNENNLNCPQDCPSICGDASLDEAEECDLGNLNGENSCCSQACAFDPAGHLCSNSFFVGHCDGQGHCVQTE